MSRQGHHRPPLRRLLATGGTFLLLVALLMVPSAARSPDIRHIQNGDMIFIYEQNLDLTGLRTGADPVTSLRKYVDDNPAKALIKEVPVQDDTDFSPSSALFGGQTGIFYAFNPADGPMGSVSVTVPSVSIDVVLANPYHADVVSGYSVSPTTPVAFRITATDVGSSYHAGTLYPATVDLVLTSPGGGQLTTFQGRDFSRINLSGAVIYTDDPGQPGAIDFDGLEGGTYSVQAKWRDPASFDQQAPDSNSYSFTVGNRVSSGTTPQPATTMATPGTTVTTPAPTALATPAPTTPATAPPTVPVPETTTLPPATTPVTPSPAGTTAPAPTATPTMPVLAVLSPALALFFLVRTAKRR